jgi:hypothetical protein
MSNRIRGQETTLQVVVNGQIQGRSFAKVENFKWSPRQDLSDSSFLGETEDEPDIMHHGYDFSFSIHEEDNSAVEQVLLQVVNTLTAGVQQPDITLTFIKRYRDPAMGTKTLVFPKCKLKLDSQEMGSRKDYLKSSFSGKCRQMQSL